MHRGSDLAKRFEQFEKRSPWLGVHLGLRRDCGSTFSPVQQPVAVTDTALREYVFEGAINNYPSDDVQAANDNYLAGVREIGVRSEYTDGRDRPRLRVRSVEFEGPFYESWPPATHRRIFIGSANEDKPELYAREIVRAFAGRAFRRPITVSEESSLMAVWKESYTDQPDFTQSIKDTLLIVLTSPQFLFLIEKSDTPKPEPLTDHELASKLSYFLWNTMPDPRLQELAAAGKLRAALDTEITRLIAAPRFGQFANEFASQWLSLDKFDVVEMDYKKFPASRATPRFICVSNRSSCCSISSAKIFPRATSCNRNSSWPTRLPPVTTVSASALREASPLSPSNTNARTSVGCSRRPASSPAFPTVANPMP